MIKIAKSSDLNDIVNISKEINKQLLKEGFDQWNHGYPNKDTFALDIKESTQYTLWQDDDLAGIISINPSRNDSFFNAQFKDKSNNFRVISRLAIRPNYQGLGLAGEMMDFAEETIKNSNYSSIRLGALKNYDKVVDFYIRRQYNICGEVYIDRTNHTYFLMEKILV